MARPKSGVFTILWVLSLFVMNYQTNAYTPLSKESIFADVLLTELLNRMDKEMESNHNYIDMDVENAKNLDMISRSSKSSDDYEYRNLFGAHPSIRDQEYLQHSSLWGHQYVSGGMGEAPNRFNTVVKSDSSLPAYCNPPNPCPFGYDESHGCITDFENTAIFSREFQAAQECTCDNEHMFDCGRQDDGVNNSEMASTMDFFMHQFQNDNELENSNSVVKKFYNFEKASDLNPFLQGEKLPIAAKKGNHIPF